MNRKPVIACDIDEVLNNLFEVWLNFYNKESGDKLTINDFTSWRIDRIVKPEYSKRILEYLTDKQISNILFKTCTPQNNSIEVTQWLQTFAELHLVTSTHYNNFAPKCEWLKRYYPHINIDTNVNVMHEKYLFCADFLIDDKFENCKSFPKIALLVTKPWNKSNQYERRVNNWLEIKAYFQRLINLGIIKEVA